MSRTATAASEPRPELDDADREILDGVKRALDGGVELKKWWEVIDESGGYKKKFQEAHVFQRPEDKSFGFFETAELRDGKTKVIGNVQEQLYHRPKERSAHSVQKQIKEFVLRYFMRVSVYRTPQPEAEGRQSKGLLKYLSQFPSEEDYKLQGFGYSQRYYKRRDARKECKFPEAERNVILDLRDVKDHYEWVLVRNPIVDFQLNVRPLGVRGPELTIPLPTATNWVVMSPDTITIDEAPKKEGLLARYGIGYAFMREPGKPGIFAYGPGQLEPTVQTIIWEVHDNGDVIVRMCFVSNAPTGILNVSANPFRWGFTAADTLTAGQFTRYLEPFRNAVSLLPFSNTHFDPVYPAVRILNGLTLGAAGRQLGISRDELNKALTYAHFLQHYNAVLGSRQTWEMIRDWTKEEELPEWVRKGESA